MISLDKVDKSYQRDFWVPAFKALDNVSFQIKSGEITGFLGANGAGKTTLIKTILGFIKQDKGEIRTSPELGKNRYEFLSKIGYMPERPYFYPNLTGDEFVAFLADLSGVPRKLMKERRKTLGEKLRIDHALQRKLKTYSKGMLQRVGLLSAIIHAPRLLILDEPLSGIDPIGRKEMKDIIVDLHKQGTSIFFSSHIVPDMEEICDSVVFLEKGRLIYQGSVDELIHKNSSKNFLLTIKRSENDIQEMQYGKVIQENNDIRILEVKPEDKTKVLDFCLKKNLEVLGLGRQKLTLEEVVYNVKGHEVVGGD